MWIEWHMRFGNHLGCRFDVGAGPWLRFARGLYCRRGSRSVSAGEASRRSVVVVASV